MPGPFHSWLPSLPVAREIVYVVCVERRWKDRHNELLSGPYKDRKDALLAAITEAHKRGAAGGGAQVYAQVGEDEYQLAWTYGLDPKPAERQGRQPPVTIASPYI